MLLKGNNSEQPEWKLNRHTNVVDKLGRRLQRFWLGHEPGNASSHPHRLDWECGSLKVPEHSREAQRNDKCEARNKFIVHLIEWKHKIDTVASTEDISEIAKPNTGVSPSNRVMSKRVEIDDDRAVASNLSFVSSKLLVWLHWENLACVYPVSKQSTVPVKEHDLWQDVSWLEVSLVFWLEVLCQWRTCQEKKLEGRNWGHDSHSRNLWWIAVLE